MGEVVMLTSFDEYKCGNAEQIGWSEMPQILTGESLTQSPTDPRSVLLWMVGSLKAQYGEPVEHELLEWHLEHPSGDEARMVDLVEEFEDASTRREHLFLMLGDLADLGLITQDPRGLFLTSEGTKVLEKLEVIAKLEAH